VEALRRCVLRLTAALGAPAGGRLDGITAASVQMLSKMISRYDVTKARGASCAAAAPFPAAPAAPHPATPGLRGGHAARAERERAERGCVRGEVWRAEGGGRARA